MLIKKKIQKREGGNEMVLEKRNASRAIFLNFNMPVNHLRDLVTICGILLNPYSDSINWGEA